MPGGSDYPGPVAALERYRAVVEGSSHAPVEGFGILEPTSTEKS